MRENSLSVKLLSGVVPKYSLVVGDEVERKVVEIVEMMKVHCWEISDWMNGMRLKDLAVYEVFEDKIKGKEQLLPKTSTLIELCTQLLHNIRL